MILRIPQVVLAYGAGEMSTQGFNWWMFGAVWKRAAMQELLMP